MQAPLTPRATAKPIMLWPRLAALILGVLGQAVTAYFAFSDRSSVARGFFFGSMVMFGLYLLLTPGTDRRWRLNRTFGAIMLAITLLAAAYQYLR